MSAVIAELDANLQALRALKPPGVTKSKIAAITTLCIENVASESVLVQKIYTHFKRTPATHKLGVLYVVDSVTRQWVDKARVTGEELTGAAATDGTFAAGVHKMTELLPAMMNDLIQSAPEDQTEKTGKLIDIWERGNTFPTAMLSDFKVKLKAKTNANGSTKQSPYVHQTTIEQPNQPTTTPSFTVPPVLPNWTSQGSAQNNTLQAVSQAGGLVHPNPPIPYSMPPAPAANGDDALAKALESVIPLHIREDKVALQQQLQILQQLHAMNVPKEQWPAVIAAVNVQKGLTPQVSTPTTEINSYRPPPQNNPASSNTVVSRPRSRSPGRRLRDSPDYTYAGQNGNGYRQRSPMRDSIPVQQPDTIPLNGAPKWIEYDPSLPPNHIKVLSRTLFIGGATCSESELREIFSRFGKVQTVIAQPEKRCAFIKMCTRKDAVNAREKMENNHDKVRSTRWGVGFGPRDCSDYATGISIIPIDRLTEADRKWVVTAEFGGTGGKPLTPGLVIEEPDIEIGAGVSSKVLSQAISRRNGAGHDNNSSSASGSGGHRGRGNAGGAGRDRHSGGGGGHRNRNNRHNDPPAAATSTFDQSSSTNTQHHQLDFSTTAQMPAFNYSMAGLLPQPQGQGQGQGQSQGQAFQSPQQLQQMQMQFQQMAQLQQQQQNQHQHQHQPNLGMGAPGTGGMWS